MKDNVKKVFEMLNLKPYEEFNIGDEGLLFRLDENLNVQIKDNNQNIWEYNSMPDYQLNSLINGYNKITKPLLTDKEREVLKLFEFDKIEKDDNVLWKDGVGIRLIQLEWFEYKFKGLEKGKSYTREELKIKNI